MQKINSILRILTLKKQVLNQIKLKGPKTRK